MKKSVVGILNRMHHIFAICLVCVSCLGQDQRSAITASSPSVSGAAGDAIARVRPALPDDYRIGNSDVLMVNVWHETEISREVPVRPDGRISLPLIGDVQARGLTASELQAGIAELDAGGLKCSSNSQIVCRRHRGLLLSQFGASDGGEA